MYSSVRHIVSVVLALSAVLVSGRDRAQIYATVVGDVKTPVSGLGTADFVLRDGGTRIGVLNAVPATDPLSVAVVVSGFDVTDVPALRRAIEDLVRTTAARNPGSRIGLMIGDGALGSRVAMMSGDAAGVESALRQSTGTRRNVIDAIVAACDALREAPADRRTVLAIIRPQERDGGLNARGRAVDAILAARAALWTIEVGPAAPAGSGAALDDTLSEGVRISGALREKVAAGTDVPAATARVVGRWLSQYLVTYTWPEPMVSQFSLTTRHDAGEVLTPAWMR